MYPKEVKDHPKHLVSITSILFPKIKGFSNMAYIHVTFKLTKTYFKDTEVI